MKQIYILLSKTETLPSRLIHSMTGGAYTHASIALVPQTDRFYSYARRTVRNPLNAGIIKENTNELIFALYPHCRCTLYSIEVSDEGYQKIKDCMRHYWRNYRRAKYNFLGAIPLRLGIKIERKYKLVCSQFVAIALKASGEIRLPKDPYLMLPNDFQSIEGMKLIYDGSLKECNFNPTKAKIPTL